MATAFSVIVYRPIAARVTAGGNGRIRTNFDGYSTRYQGVDFTITKRLANRWMMRLATAYNNPTQHFDSSNLVGAFGNPTQPMDSSTRWRLARSFLRRTP